MFNKRYKMLSTVQAYPNRQEKIEEIYNGVKSDIENNSMEMSIHMGSLYWHKGFCILDDTTAEFEMFDHLMDEMIAETPESTAMITTCFNTIKGRITTKKIAKIKYTPSEEFINELSDLATYRNNYKPLTGDPVTPEHLEKILSFAAGMTPALSNEYNYRVDVVPDAHKIKLYEDTKQYSQAAHDSGNLGYAVDENSQLKAPTTLVWSLRYDIKNDSINQFCGPMTDRDPNLINLGMSLWHTCLGAEALGYKTAFAIMSGLKRDKVKAILGMNTTDPQDEFTLSRDGQTEFMPMVFLCIGTEGGINSNSRSTKHEDIINKLAFNEIAN